MLFLSASVLCSEPLNAQVQVYPVSVTTRLTPPYSVNLADYAAPGCEQLKVIIVQRDLTQAPYMLYLRMEIELNGRVIIRTSPEYIPPALTLDPGIPTVISGIDLAGFFDPSHLEFTGYSREDYMRTKILPEGSYTITFTAYDQVRRDVALSRGGSMFCYLAKTEPPMLNLPLNNAVVRCQNPQYINFQWISRSMSSPNSALSTAYRFELFEMRTGGHPGDVVQNTRPVFTCETDRTSLQYTISETQLIKGMRYAWRIRAFDRLGRDYIRNNGYSEVYSFLYDDTDIENGTISFNEIQNFSAEAIGPRKALLKWDSSPEYSSYKISYRENEGGKWFEDETDKNSAELAGLTPGTIYDCRVQGKRGRSWGSYSESDTVRMPMLPVIECGNPFLPLSVSNREPLLELRRLQQFDAGGFMVTVMDPYAATFSPGRFTGRGYVRVPLFGHKKIACEFNDIFINTDYQMAEGSVRLLYDSNNNLLINLDDEFEGGGDNGRVKEGTEQADVSLRGIIIKDVNEIIPDLEGREILIVKNGDTTHVDISGQQATTAKSLTIKDEAGNIYSVDAATGKVTSMGKALPGGSRSLSIPSIIDSKTGQVTFERANETKFAFDKWDDKYKKANLFTEEYGVIKTSGNSSYYVPVKLIPTGETDMILAKVEKGKADSIQFVSGTGTVYTAAKQDDGKYLLTLPAAKENDGYEIFAMSKDGMNNQVLLGKLTVVSYSVKKPKLVLVPVNGTGKDTDVSKIKQELDKIYHSVAVDWQVEKDTVFYPADKTIGNTLDVTGSGLFSQYTESMKVLNSAFIEAKNGDIDESAIYLFMIKSATGGTDEGTSVTGDMPRSKQFGYLFMETLGKYDEATIRTIAHEISHGAFHLNHTFDNQYRIEKGNTDNLMDYSAGTSLVKHQWDAIHDPGLVIGLFERDEEGAMSLPCLGWFDDCKNVIQMLEEVRNARIKEQKFKLSAQSDSSASTLMAKYVKIGDISYKQIRLIYKPENTESSLDPRTYYKYNQQHLNTKGEIDNQHGFAFMKNNKELFRIIVDDDTAKISKLKVYLFGYDKKSNIFIEATWTSQFSQNINGRSCHWCSGTAKCCSNDTICNNSCKSTCKSNNCCYQSCLYMIEGFNLTTNRAQAIDVADLANPNSWKLDTDLTFNSAKFEEGSKYIDQELASGKPIIIGVHYNNEHNGTYNSNKSTFHFMVIVGVYYKNDIKYYRFFDPGRLNKSKGAAETNLFEVKENEHKFQCTYNGKTYTITEIRKNL